jgi:hypothetical protein
MNEKVLLASFRTHEAKPFVIAPQHELTFIRRRHDSASPPTKIRCSDRREFQSDNAMIQVQPGTLRRLPNRDMMFL